MTEKPRATYRLQLHKNFTFQDATRLVGYLNDLGISHIYSSPFFRASPGSLHGYDICDHNELNPEIGTREDFDSLVNELRRYNMGLIVDFVPNHMGISDPDNQWWRDVLENGPASPYARFFDIEWNPLKRELENKVLLPILGDQYGKVLESGDLKISYSAGVFTLHCPGVDLPLAARSIRPILRRAAELIDKTPDELLSIITALDNLPSRIETDPDKITERLREKSVIRDRLIRLGESHPEVEAGILSAMQEWQDSNDADSLDRLDALLSDQAYRLSYWRVAAEEINYRRFFDVNSLAGIRVELPEVFDATHELLLELLAKRQLDGVRIDHIDGLAFPARYLEKLREKMKNALGDETGGLLLVEKILAIGEKLRPEWKVDGTTGYEFACQIMNVLVDRSSEKAITQCYTKFIDDKLDYKEVVHDGKRLVMACEVNVLGMMLSRLAEGHRWYRDFTVNALNTAIREVIACFPVYRSYIEPENVVSDADANLVGQAIALARRRNTSLERSIFDFVRTVLLAPAGTVHTVDEDLRRAFVLKFQQCTSPISAKGVEDTAFYRYNRLVALNEVGSNPGVFGLPVEAFHKQCQARLAEWPNAMLATSTHDTKRSEDVRARILALSVVPDEWSKATRKWQTLNRKHKAVLDGQVIPDANEEFFIYQTLLGTWPLEAMNDEQHDVYIKRIQDYMTKALHEAKLNSSWIDPNESWDKGVNDFISRILARDEKNRFMETFLPLAGKLAELGMVNSLAQTTLKFTTPGIPDTYQGTEIWDFSLVDPDNRRPVDYDQRRQLLSGQRTPTELLEGWRDGGIKLFIVQRLLNLRKERPDLFTEGSYEPLTASGPKADSCLVFMRRTETQSLLVIVPRLTLKLGFPPVGECWGDTTVSADVAVDWEDVFTGAIHCGLSPIRVADILKSWPIAVLKSNNKPQ